MHGETVKKKNEDLCIYVIEVFIISPSYYC